MNMSQVSRLTISLPIELISFADELATERNVSRSKVFSDCLQELSEKRKLASMEEGYKAMAQQNLELAKIAFGIAQEVVPAW